MPADAHLLLLDRTQVQALLDPDEVLAAVHTAFVLHARQQGRVFPVIREPLPDHGAVFGIKAGAVPADELLGFKAAGFWPGNRERGGDAHQATIVLIDPATGRPRCVIDGNAITTWRTGAAGALGLQRLARADAQRLCVFGTGVQGRIQVHYALRVLPTLRELRYVTHDGTPDAAFEADVSAAAPSLTILHAAARNEAVAASDVVITATPGSGPLFDAEAVQPGTHLNGVGADTRGKRELPRGLLDRARLFVDDAAQSAQLGELQWAPDTPCIELGACLAGAAAFQRQPSDITVFDMTGLALQDLTVAHLLLTRAVRAGVGTSVAWPW